MLGQYLPIVCLMVLAVAFGALSFGGVAPAGPAPAELGQVGAVRVRHRAEPGHPGALPGDASTSWRCCS